MISYAHSKQLYNGAGSYTAKLENYCAIAKCTLYGSGTNNDVYVRGMYNTVTVNFAANNYANSTTGSPYSFSKGGNGTIKLHSESATEKWAIVLEQDAVTADLLADGFKATTVSVPKIERNTYHASDISPTSLTAGSKVCYSFTSDDKGSVVRFSQGNLQYIGSATIPYWKFADNQYDSLGTKTGQNSAAENVDRDLFGWGTTGYQDTRTSSKGYQTNYNPYSTSKTAVGSSDPAYNINKYGYGPDYYSSSEYGLTVANQSDWGMHAISYGGNIQNFDWHTLTSAEWVYLFNGRSEIGVETRFAKACLFGSVHGVILFPDNYTHPDGVAALTGVNETDDTSWDGNQYIADDWGKMEAAGCVFLPTTGYRDGISVSKVDSRGYYWSSSSNSSSTAYFVLFTKSYLKLQETAGRYRGNSVRLVF